MKWIVFAVRLPLATVGFVAACAWQAIYDGWYMGRALSQYLNEISK